MRRHSDRDHTLREALGNLWATQVLADVATRFEGVQAGFGVWLRNGAEGRRCVRVACAMGRGGDLPPMLLENREYFNCLGWEIPDLAKRSDQWQS